MNEYGRKLVELCIATNLLIVNGRTKSDPMGSFTWYTCNGSSVVDYVLGSRDIIDYMDLKVDNMNALSDHCSIHLHKHTRNHTTYTYIIH